MNTSYVWGEEDNNMNKLDRFTKYKEVVEKLNNNFSYDDGDYWIKGRLGTLLYDIKKQIKIEEDIQKQQNDPEIHVPKYWFSEEAYKTINKDGTIYKIPTERFLKESGEFNVDATVYIPNGEGVISLNVHMVKTNDSYGERFFVSSVYYKTRNLQGFDNHSYYSKSYGKGHRYPVKFKNEVMFVLEEFSKQNGVEFSF